MPSVTVATIQNGNPGQNEVQRITFTGQPTGGTFTLSYAGETTAAIPYNASCAEIEAALELLSNIDNVSVSLS